MAAVERPKIGSSNFPGIFKVSRSRRIFIFGGGGRDKLYRPADLNILLDFWGL